MSRLPYRPLSISQNFLHSRALVDRLLAVSSIRPGDLVYDLGAGTGLITDRLARRGCQVVAVEMDLELAEQLWARFEDTPAIRVRHTDILAVPFPRRAYKVFANIPFNATAAIVQHLTQAPNPPEDSYLVVQAEAALRFTGQPRGTLISALLKPWFEPTIVHRFSRSDFAPPPRVEVVMLRLRKRGPPLVQSADARGYRDFMVSVFAGRHGTIDATLRALMGSRRARRVEAQLALDRAASPSALTFASWLDLFNIWKDAIPPQARSGLAGAERRLVHQQQRRLRKSHRTSRFSNPRLVIECRPPPFRQTGLAALPVSIDVTHHGAGGALGMLCTILAVSVPRPSRECRCRNLAAVAPLLRTCAWPSSRTCTAIRSLWTRYSRILTRRAVSTVPRVGRPGRHRTRPGGRTGASGQTSWRALRAGQYRSLRGERSATVPYLRGRRRRHHVDPTPG